MESEWDAASKSMQKSAFDEEIEESSIENKNEKELFDQFNQKGISIDDKNPQLKSDYRTIKELSTLKQF